MKILVVHNEYQNRGGEDSVVAAEAALLAAAGHTVVHYRRTNHEIMAASSIQKASLAANTLWSRGSFRAIRELLDRERPAVAHFHNTFPLISPSAYAACRDARIPVVQTLHNYRLLCAGANLLRDGQPCEDCLGKWSSWPGVLHACYRESRAATSVVAVMHAVHRTLGTWQDNVDAFIALSEFSRIKFMQGGLPAKKIIVKGNFVDPDPGCREVCGEYAIFVGRLSAEKGLRALLAAWSLIGKSLPLRIVGDGPLLETLESDRKTLALENVTFLGRLDRDLTLKAIKNSRFLVLPSTCYESFPMVIAEAYACGVPVIAAGHGAMAELVEEGRTGLLFKPGDSRDLAAKLQWAFGNPRALEGMGHAARAKFASQYAAKSNLAKLLKIYEHARATSDSRAIRPATAAMKAISQPFRQETVPGLAKRFDVLGVPVNATQIPEVIEAMKQWIGEHNHCHAIAVTGMHGVMEAQHDRAFKDVLNAADVVVPDGMPLVWLGRLRGHRLRRRVYGPELMMSFCEQTARAGYRHFFYGGAPGVPEKLAGMIQARLPGLQVAGTYSPPYRALTPEEDAQAVAMINATAPDIIWVGLGTPKQEIWMHEHRKSLNASVLVGVGAAFDIHAGTKAQAPVWMQEHGLEWLFRLAQEPARLWRRYLIYGSEFLVRVCWEFIRSERKQPAR
jgi:exopolysaccharide biosynthesis WecB/TagA/CpsF family protein